MRKRGLTLPELLVIVSILMILAAIAIMYLRTQIFKGNDAKRKGDMHKIQVAIEEYEKDHNCYPPPELVVCDPGDGLKPYLSKVPCDPTTQESYYYEPQGSGCPSWYRLYTNLENLNDEDIVYDYIGPDCAYNYCAKSPNAPEPECVGPQQLYGCNGAGGCVPINWDPTRGDAGGGECDLNWTNETCHGYCENNPTATCAPWQ